MNRMVYEVQKEDYEKRLAYYETGAYQYAACFIAPGAAGEQIFGKTAALELEWRRVVGTSSNFAHTRT